MTSSGAGGGDENNNFYERLKNFVYLIHNQKSTDVVVHFISDCKPLMIFPKQVV